MYEATTPSFVAREAFFPALAIPLVRKMVSAFSRSPPLSTRARLQSIKPALVFSRSCLTSWGSISAVVFIKCQFLRVEVSTHCACDATQASGRNASHFDLLADARFVACRDNGIDELLQNHANRTDRVIVASNWIIDDVWICVRVHDGDHWNPKAPGFVHGVLFADRVDHNESIGKLRHLKYPIEIASELRGL